MVEPDEDAWHAYCPALLNQGGSTWGVTREEALAQLREAIQLVVESLVAHGESIPDQPADQVQVITEPKVAITV
ncbi:MAG: hypothetical protein BWZ08_00200 [candidate division BRC1 bacterium ADurb.BinA292]|nr:MAG: hypothetical protein BWZ08_00200 [candidate division BRC1 bacterium ADurb.BinA292]